MSANSNLQNCCGDGRGWRLGEPVPLSITARPVRARGGRTRGGTECRLHVLEAGWQKRHGGVPGSEQGWWMGGESRRRERAGNRWVCVQQTTWTSCVCVQRDLCVYMLFIRAHPCVLVTMHAFACMSMRMSTHSWGQTLTHKWNLATWVPGSLSWACTAADLASLSGAVSMRQDSKRPSLAGRGRGGERGAVTSREPLPKKRASVAREEKPRVGTLHQLRN